MSDSNSQRDHTDPNWQQQQQQQHEQIQRKRQDNHEPDVYDESPLHLATGEDPEFYGFGDFNLGHTQAVVDDTLFDDEPEQFAGHYPSLNTVPPYQGHDYGYLLPSTGMWNANTHSDHDYTVDNHFGGYGDTFGPFDQTMAPPGHHHHQPHHPQMAPALPQQMAPQDMMFNHNHNNNTNNNNSHPHQAPQLNTNQRLNRDDQSHQRDTYPPPPRPASTQGAVAAHNAPKTKEEMMDYVDKHNVLQFEPCERLSRVYDHLGHEITPVLRGGLIGNFFLSPPTSEQQPDVGSEQQAKMYELTFYRRNLFQVTIVLTDHSQIASCALPQKEGRSRVLTLLAEVCVVGSDEADRKPLLYSKPKDTKGEASAGNDEAEGPQHECTPNSKTIYRERGNLFHGDWKRLQFKSATAHNGRKKLQNFFAVEVCLFAELENGQRVCVVRARSKNIVVRGRNPRFYHDRDQISLVGDRNPIDGFDIPTGSRRGSRDSREMDRPSLPPQVPQQAQQALPPVPPAAAAPPPPPPLQQQQQQNPPPVWPEHDQLINRNRENMHYGRHHHHDTNAEGPFQPTPGLLATQRQQMDVARQGAKLQRSVSNQMASPRNMPPVGDQVHQVVSATTQCDGQGGVGVFDDGKSGSAVSNSANAAADKDNNGVIVHDHDNDEDDPGPQYSIKNEPGLEGSAGKKPPHTRMEIANMYTGRGRAMAARESLSIDPLDAAHDDGAAMMMTTPSLTTRKNIDNGNNSNDAKGTRVRNNEMDYEYFGMAKQYWMPPVEVVYRPHAVHHPLNHPNNKGVPTSGMKRYFSQVE